MADLPPDKAEELRRKSEIVYELRALVKQPGWLYLCTVMEAARMTVLLSLKEATTQDELIRNNGELREAEMYKFLPTQVQSIINEFEAELEGFEDA
jgi:hypothetical protein